MIPGAFPVGVGGLIPSVTYVTNSAQLESTTSVTRTSISLGDARSDRSIVLPVAFTNADQITSITVGGVSASAAVQSAPVGVTTRSDIWIASVPTGTTGDIVFTAPSAFGAIAFGVYAVYSLLSITPTDTASDTTASLSLDADVQANGVLIGCAVVNSGAPGSATWSGASEDYESSIGGGTFVYSGASYTATTAQSPLTVSVTGLVGNQVGTSAAFR